MLRRATATATLNGHAAAWFRRLLNRGLMTLPPAHLRRHYPQSQLQLPRAVVSAPPPLPRLCGGARGYNYRRMARRIPTARPDGYSSSDGEAEEPDAREEALETTEPVGAGDDSEGSESEVEGFMLDLGALSGDGDKEGIEEEGK